MDTMHTTNTTETNTIDSTNSPRALARVNREEGSLWTEQQVETIKRLIAPGISNDELSLFAIICSRTGLDPFQRQIYAIKRRAKVGDEWTDRMTIQTGIDGYRLIAARTGDLAGIDDALFDTEDADHPNRASVTVYRFVRDTRVAFTATARWREYAQLKRDGTPTDMWGRMPYLMLGKCAEALALRKAFPAELSGVYTHEEMTQADHDQGAPQSWLVETKQAQKPQAALAPAPTAVATPAVTVVESNGAPRPTKRMATPEQWTALRNLCGKVGAQEPEPGTLTYERAGSMIAEYSETYKRLLAQRQRQRQQGQTQGSNGHAHV